MFDMPRTGSWEVRGGWVLRHLMADLGLADYQAAGLAGNLGFESIGLTALQEIAPVVSGSRGGGGWGQWTGPRRRAFEAWCLKNHLPVASDEGNYGYLLAELRGENPAYDYTSTVKALKRCATLEASVFSVGQTYERPGGTTRTHLPGYDGRLDWAKRALLGARQQDISIAAVGDPGLIHPDLTLHSTGDAVAELQRRLTALGYPCGTIDGDFGSLTDGAAEAFMKARGVWPGVTVTGSTWNELAHAEAEKLST